MVTSKVGKRGYSGSLIVLFRKWHNIVDIAGGRLRFVFDYDEYSAADDGDGHDDPENQ